MNLFYIFAGTVVILFLLFLGIELWHRRHPGEQVVDPEA